MECEFQKFECPVCQIDLFFSITKEDYGKIGKITCMYCENSYLVAILDQDKLKSLAVALNRAVAQALCTDHITSIIKEIRELRGKTNFDINLGITPITFQLPDEPPIPLAKKSTMDIDFLKDLGIKIDF